MLRGESMSVSQAYLTRDFQLLGTLITSLGANVLLTSLEITNQDEGTKRVATETHGVLQTQRPATYSSPEGSFFKVIKKVILNCSQVWKTLA